MQLTTVTTAIFLHRGSLLEAEDGNGDSDVIRSRLGGNTGGPKHTSMKMLRHTVK